MKSTRIDYPGLDVFAVEGSKGDTYVMDLPIGFVSPYLVVYEHGTLERIAANYPGEPFPVEAPGLSEIIPKMLPRDAGKTICTVTSETYRHYCISHPLRNQVIEKEQIELNVGMELTVPVGAILFIASGSVVCNAAQLDAPAFVEATQKPALVKAVHAVFGTRFARPK